MDAEQSRKRTSKTKSLAGLPEAKRTVSKESVEEYRNGVVTGFIGSSKEIKEL